MSEYEDGDPALPPRVSADSPSSVHVHWVKERGLAAETAPIKTSTSIRCTREFGRKDCAHSRRTHRTCLRKSKFRSTSHTVNKRRPSERSTLHIKQLLGNRTERTSASSSVSSCANPSTDGGEGTYGQVRFYGDGIPETSDKAAAALTNATLETSEPVTAEFVKETFRECFKSALPPLIKALRSTLPVTLSCDSSSELHASIDQPRRKLRKQSTSGKEYLKDVDNGFIFATDKDLSMETIVPLVFEALPESFCQRPPSLVMDEFTPDDIFSSQSHARFGRLLLPQSNQLLKELLTHGSALRQTTRCLDPAAPLPPPNAHAANNYFGMKRCSSKPVWQVQTFSEAERLPAECPMDYGTNIPLPTKVSITLQQYETEERMLRAALRANSHADLMYSAAFANLEDLQNTNNPMKVAEFHEKAMLLMMKASIFHSQAMHWTTKSLANSMLHRRDACLKSALLSPEQKLTLRCLPFHDAKSLFCGKLAALAPSTLEMPQSQNVDPSSQNHSKSRLHTRRHLRPPLRKGSDNLK